MNEGRCTGDLAVAWKGSGAWRRKERNPVYRREKSERELGNSP